MLAFYTRVFIPYAIPVALQWLGRSVVCEVGFLFPVVMKVVSGVVFMTVHICAFICAYICAFSADSIHEAADWTLSKAHALTYVDIDRY